MNKIKKWFTDVWPWWCENFIGMWGVFTHILLLILFFQMIFLQNRVDMLESTYVDFLKQFLQAVETAVAV